MEQLSEAVDALLAIDPGTLPTAALGEGLLAMHRQLRRVESAYFAWLAAFDRAGGAAEEGYACTAAWLRTRARVDGTEAGADIRLARALADVMPSVAAGMAAGAVGRRSAQVISSLRDDIGDDALVAAEGSLAAAARDCPTTVLRRFTAVARQQYAPEAAAQHDRDQYDARELSVATSLWGMGTGSWWLPPAMQDRVLAVLNAMAAPRPGDTRSAGQRRADALLDMADRAAAALPDDAVQRTALTVTVGAASLGQRPAAAGNDAPLPDWTDQDRRPAETSLGQHLGADWLLRFSCDAIVARVVFGPAGQVLDAGRATRLFTPAQRRAIVARDRHCVWPGCTAPAAWCDAHHVQHWSRGGVTSVSNGALLCGRHHDRVHLHGHRIHPGLTGAMTVDLRQHSDPDWHPPPHSRR